MAIATFSPPIRPGSASGSRISAVSRGRWRFNKYETHQLCDAMECIENDEFRIAKWSRLITIDGVAYIQCACDEHAKGASSDRDRS
jgi:hypothetical protein